MRNSTALRCAQYFARSVGEHYFVDTQALVLLTQTGVSSSIKKFVQSPGNHFYYTESAEDQFKVLSQSTSCDFSRSFKFVPSGITSHQKKLVLDFFHDDLERAFSKRLLQASANTILSIVEAGYVCHAPGVLPDTYFTPKMLIGDEHIYRKIIDSPEKAQQLDEVIQILGLERLIDVERFEDTAAAYVDSSLPLPL